MVSLRNSSSEKSLRPNCELALAYPINGAKLIGQRSACERRWPEPALMSWKSVSLSCRMYCSSVDKTSTVCGSGSRWMADCIFSSSSFRGCLFSGNPPNKETTMFLSRVLGSGHIRQAVTALPLPGHGHKLRNILRLAGRHRHRRATAQRRTKRRQQNKQTNEWMDRRTTNTHTDR